MNQKKIYQLKKKKKTYEQMQAWEYSTRAVCMYW